jgi:hypothetical protein
MVPRLPVAPEKRTSLSPVDKECVPDVNVPAEVSVGTAGEDAAAITPNVSGLFAEPKTKLVALLPPKSGNTLHAVTEVEENAHIRKHAGESETEKRFAATTHAYSLVYRRAATLCEQTEVAPKDGLAPVTPRASGLPVTMPWLPDDKKTPAGFTVAAVVVLLYVGATNVLLLMLVPKTKAPLEPVFAVIGRTDVPVDVAERVSGDEKTHRFVHVDDAEMANLSTLTTHA